MKDKQVNFFQENGKIINGNGNIESTKKEACETIITNTISSFTSPQEKARKDNKDDKVILKDGKEISF